jgi:c-di-GMP-binding flagellar brake protein YcgR
MTNRRLAYRHPFPPADRPAVRLRRAAGATVEARVLDLSVGGLAAEMETPELAVGERATATLELGPDAEPLSAPVEVVHRRGDMSVLGLRFLAVTSIQVTEEREKRLWRYLLDAQRLQRRRLRAG